MRLASVLPLLVACATAPPEPVGACDPQTCLDQCRELRSGMPGIPDLDTPIDEVVLTDAEWAVFADEILAVRRGWTPTLDTRVGICRGTDTCEVPLGRDLEITSDGPHVVAIELRPPPAPPDATTEVVYRQRCRHQELVEGKVLDNTDAAFQEVTLVREDDGAAQQVVLFELPRQSPDARHACGYVIEVSNPLQVDRYEGSYVVQLPEGRERAFREALYGVLAPPSPVDEGPPPSTVVPIEEGIPIDDATDAPPPVPPEGDEARESP